MAVAPLDKIRIIAPQAEKEEILESLQNLGFVQIDHAADDLKKQNLTEIISSYDYKIAGITFALEYLSNFSTEKRKFLPTFDNQIETSWAGVLHAVENTDFEHIVSQAQEIEAGINEATSYRTRLTLELEQLQPWMNLALIPGETLSNTYIYQLLEVNHADANIPDVINKLSEKTPLTSVETISQTKEKTWFVLFYRKADESAVQAIIDEVKAQPVELPVLTTSVADATIERERQKDKYRQKISDLENEAKSLSKSIPALKIGYDYFTWQKEKALNAQKAGLTESTFVLTGWVEARLYQNLDKTLAKITDSYVLERLPLAENEVMPTVFKNTWAQPFESVTTLFGAPQITEPDPTPFLAPFFTLFFGLAMTDAGYGIVITLGVYLAIKILKIPKHKQKLLRVLMWGGVATFIMGALVGGWFSIDLATLPPAVSEPLRAVQVIDPIKDPLTIFYLSLALGVVQVLFGLGIDTWWKIKTGSALDGILGSGAWIFTIISLLIFAAGSMGFAPESVGTAGKWMSLIGAGILIFNGARGTKNILLKPALGLLSLYGIVGYFSDVLSYSRLLALGLTTGIIGMVVNVIAGLTFSIPYVGWLVALVILVVGHAFNIVVNALGAYIHSGRLQFIEFFPKFMEAKGELFVPFTKEAKYIKLTN